MKNLFLTALVLLLGGLNLSFADTATADSLKKSLTNSIQEVISNQDEEEAFITSADVNISTLNIDSGALGAEIQVTTVGLDSNGGAPITLKTTITSKVTSSNTYKAGLTLHLGFDPVVMANKLISAQKNCETTEVTTDGQLAIFQHLENIKCDLANNLPDNATAVSDFEGGIAALVAYAEEALKGQTAETEAGELGIANALEVLSKVEFVTDKGADTITATYNSSLEIFETNADAKITLDKTGLSITFKGQATFKSEQVSTYTTKVKDHVSQLQTPGSELHHKIFGESGLAYSGILLVGSFFDFE